MSKKIALKWLKQALHDLEMAEKNVDISGYDVAAFLAHQSVEKLLKAILAIKGLRVPKIHYIDELGKKLKLKSEVTELIAELTVDYTLSRYPDVSERVPYEVYDEEIAREKVEIAKKIFELVKEFYETLLGEKEDG